MTYDVYHGEGYWALGLPGSIPEEIKPVGSFEAVSYDEAQDKLCKFIKKHHLKIRHATAIAIPRKDS